MSAFIKSRPIGWELVPLTEMASLVRGVTYKKEYAHSTARDGYVPLLRATNITGTSLTFDALVYVPQSCVSNDQLLSEGDVVIASSSGSKEIVGKAGQFSGGAFQGAFGAFCTGIRPHQELYARYLGYYCQSPDYRQVISDISAGSNINNIKSSELSAHLVPLPPRAEQTRIVEKLEELLSDLDAGVAELKAAQKKLIQYRQSLLKAAVEGTLTADWRAVRGAGNAETETGAQLLARILTERRSRWETRQLDKFQAQGKSPPKDWQAKYLAPVEPDTAGLPALPLGWVWVSAEQLCDFITKGTTPSKGLDGGGGKVIPFLRVTNLTDKGVLDMADKVFVSEETHCGFLARSVVYPNDVLMNIVGPPLGQVSVVPETFPEWNINQAIAIFRAVSGVLPGFLSLNLLSPPAQRWLKARSKTTAGQTNLTLEVCRSLPFPLPPQAEQLALITVADEAINRVTEQAQAIQISLKQSAAQRKNILQAAFSGQLVPQDPADEPASALLARIRAERAGRAAGSARGRGKKKVST